MEYITEYTTEYTTEYRFSSGIHVWNLLNRDCNSQSSGERRLGFSQGPKMKMQDRHVLKFAIAPSPTASRPSPPQRARLAPRETWEWPPASGHPQGLAQRERRSQGGDKPQAASLDCPPLNAKTQTKTMVSDTRHRIARATSANRAGVFLCFLC